MSSVLDSDEGLAVEVLEAVDREIASLLLLTARSSPDRIGFLAENLPRNVPSANNYLRDSQRLPSSCKSGPAVHLRNCIGTRTTVTGD